MKGVAAEVEVPIPPGAVMLSPEAKLLLQEIPRKQFIYFRSHGMSRTNGVLPLPVMWICIQGKRG